MAWQIKIFFTVECMLDASLTEEYINVYIKKYLVYCMLEIDRFTAFFVVVVIWCCESTSGVF